MWKKEKFVFFYPVTTKNHLIINQPPPAQQPTTKHPPKQHSPAPHIVTNPTHTCQSTLYSTHIFRAKFPAITMRRIPARRRRNNLCPADILESWAFEAPLLRRLSLIPECLGGKFSIFVDWERNGHVPGRLVHVCVLVRVRDVLNRWSLARSFSVCEDGGCGGSWWLFSRVVVFWILIYICFDIFGIIYYWISKKTAKFYLDLLNEIFWFMKDSHKIICVS